MIRLLEELKSEDQGRNSVVERKQHTSSATPVVVGRVQRGGGSWRRRQSRKGLGGRD